MRKELEVPVWQKNFSATHGGETVQRTVYMEEYNNTLRIGINLPNGSGFTSYMFILHDEHVVELEAMINHYKNERLRKLEEQLIEAIR